MKHWPIWIFNNFLFFHIVSSIFCTFMTSIHSFSDDVSCYNLFMYIWGPYKIVKQSQCQFGLRWSFILIVLFKESFFSTGHEWTSYLWWACWYDQSMLKPINIPFNGLSTWLSSWLERKIYNTISSKTSSLECLDTCRGILEQYHIFYKNTRTIKYLILHRAITQNQID